MESEGDTPAQQPVGKNTGASNFSVQGEEPRRGRTEPEAPAELQDDDSVGVVSEPDETGEDGGKKEEDSKSQ